MRIINLVVFLFLGVLVFSTCQTENKPETKSPDGEKLAIQVCTTCHKYPEPSLLDKKSWEKYMLPRMGQMLGFYKDSLERETLFEDNPGGEIVRAASVYPKDQQIPETDWKAIQKFYLEHAPDSLSAPNPIYIPRDLDLFEVKIPSLKTPPSTTYVNFRGEKVYVGDANTQSMLVFDENLKVIQQAKLREGAVWINQLEDGMLITVMGSFSPTDNPLGFILKIPNTPGEKPYPIASNLQRPVHAETGDINQDGLQDVIVCEFGKWTGGLSLLTQNPDGNYTKSVIRNSPGATKAYFRDLNRDGNLDIVALFAQGNEGIWAFYGDGKGGFREERLLHFSPSNGSSYFNLYDFNGDGYEDIIYCNGDNADFSPIFKPYHGVHVFQNDGNNSFEFAYFFHLNGAYAAIPDDYDQDGDVDIAAISFFPNFYGSPEESFVLLENDGNNEFSYHSIQNPTLGRWIVMDSGDPDGDGDTDLILGSLAFEVVPKGDFVEKWMETKIPFVVLENKTFE